MTLNVYFVKFVGDRIDTKQYNVYILGCDLGDIDIGVFDTTYDNVYDPE